MPLEEAVHFFRQLLAYPFGRCNFFDARFAQSLNRTKFSQQEILPVLAHTRAIIENAFPDSFFHQELMIGVGKTMGFIPNPLQQP